MKESLVHPIEVQQYAPPRYDPRGFFSAEKLSKPWRMNFHTTQERLKDLEKTTSVCDSIPFKNPSTHQFREFLSHSGEKALKFKPNSTTSRLVDFLTLSRTN